MIRFLRGLTALLVVGGVVVGGPIALLNFGRLDAFTQLDWPGLLTTPDDGSLVLGVVTVIGWVAWALATASLLSEALALLSGQRLRLRLPGLGVFAPASAVLITAIIGLVSAQVLTPTAANAANPASTAATASPAATAVSLSAPASPVEDSTPNPSKPGVLHTVVLGDDLWSLAEHYYDDGSRWREILVANDTVLLDATEVLQPGMLLHIPDPQPRPAAEASVTVEPGDTLSSLADEHLGDAQRWPELAAANPDRVGDPDQIDVGWQLRLPGGVEQTSATQASQTSDTEQSTAAAEQASGTEQSTDDADQPSGTEPSDDATASPNTESAPPSIEYSPAPEGPAQQTEQADDAQIVQASVWAATLPASLGVALCGGLAAAYALRRRQQQATRPLGRRLPQLPAEVAPVNSALASVIVEDDEPFGSVALRHVGLGEDAGQIVHHDLVANSMVSLQGSDGDEVSMATAIALSLASSPAEHALTIVAAGAAFEWLESLDEPRIQVVRSLRAGQEQLLELVAERRASRPSDVALSALQADPVVADAWVPTVFILAGAPPTGLTGDLADLGVTVVACAAVADAELHIRVADGQATDLSTGQRFVPYLVDQPARRALTELFTVASTDEYPPAPWWNDDESAPPTPIRSLALLPLVKDLPVTASVESEHPVVKMLGTVELVGARGTVPNRAVKQCAEYCAWLLANPGASAPAMAAALLIAETTRRSNMSRLRSWLGESPDGEPYLPDAYTGRIELHPGVTSDWEQLQLYLHGGANRASDEALVAALSLVRGAPMADAAPGQWHWAEQLRADMTGTIRDAAVVLARRALEAGDTGLAEWAVARAEVVASEDQLLAAIQIRLAHARGDQATADRLVLQLTRNARALGVDLADEVVVLLQEVIEGRARLRRA